MTNKKDNTVELAIAKKDAEIRDLQNRLVKAEACSMDRFVQLAEVAFGTRNRAALIAQAEEDDGFGTGQEPLEVRPHWHYARPLQAVCDGLHKALHGSEWNGRRGKGAIDLRDDLIRSAERRMPSAEVVQSFGGDVMRALQADVNAMSVFESISDQESLITTLEALLERAVAAYTVAANDAEYQPPAVRAANYQERDVEQAGTRATIATLAAQIKAATAG